MLIHAFANLLALAIIAVREAQNIQCHINKLQKNFGVPAALKARSASTDMVGIDCR